MSPGLRRTSAVVAITALAISGAKIASDHTTAGSGFSTVQTAAADPTGPTGGPGDGGMNGSQFQPPGLPPQQPDYQGGINQPPLDQNSGISIYNTGTQGAPQQGTSQSSQQGQQGQQPQHGTQIPDYQTATPYTQGPGKTNPDYQTPQQGQQPQQGNQQPTQTPQPNQNNQQDQQDRELQQKCEQQAQYYGIFEQLRSFIASSLGGTGNTFQQPSRKFSPAFQCNCAPQQTGPQKQSPETPAQTPSRQSNEPCHSDYGIDGLMRTVYPKISDETLRSVSTPVQIAMRVYEINSVSRISAFLAQIRAEVGPAFADLTEGSPYPEGSAAEQDYFNTNYANSNGNGDVASGDGFKYRGHGTMQLTGRGNYRNADQAFDQLLNLAPGTFESNPDYLSNPTNMHAIMRVAGWFFTDGGAGSAKQGDKYINAQHTNGNYLADQVQSSTDWENFDKITQQINGGQTGQAVRRDAFEKAYDYLTPRC
ncbi:glycoside hydrolase family 19 protein [Mycobacteroides saopaulense]|uniref:glycoside hydrolase family 19 protein n=1 Tax=Mycobacteroides saopaulense TaxID=1578165 RepID=UPI001F243974|nr:hypothetical protein [Mycobacteroides saopaulense]